MAQRQNRSFGELRETAPTDEDFLRGVGEKMGRSRSTRGKRLAAIGVWVVVIAFMLMTILSAVQVNNNRIQNVELRSMMETQYNPSFKTRYSDLGKEVIDAWYNTNPSPAPVQLAKGITWPHANDSDLTDYEASDSATDYIPSIAVRNVTYIGGRQQVSPDNSSMFYEINMYSAYVDGTLSTISVTFAIPSLDDYTTLPTLMNEPSIFPNNSALGATVETDAPSWRNVTATDTFNAQLESWAKAYTTNNTGTLKQITGDNSGSSYVGALSSKPWEYIDNSVSIVWLKENNGNTNEAVAQITWKMKLPDYSVTDPSDPDATVTRTGGTQTQRLEILVKAPASGLPLIVAWGPVGSYLTLNENTNKLTEEQFKKITSSVRVSTTPTTPSGDSEDTDDTDSTDETDTETDDEVVGGGVDEDGNPVDIPLPKPTSTP